MLMPNGFVSTYFATDRRRFRVSIGRFGALLPAVIALVCAGGAAWSQTSTGTIVGTVTDAQGASVAAANVTLLNEGTKEQQTAVTNSTGNFAFPALIAGTYTVTVEAKGFEKLEKVGNALEAQQRLSVGTLQLTVGAVTQTISVQAQAVTVQTASAESSALLSPAQMETLSSRARDVSDMLRILPGVSTSPAQDEAISPGGQGSTIPNIGGVSGSYGTMMLDGENGADAGTQSAYTLSISPDAIGEVKVLLNNYQAEYGHSGGAMINIVTKSGTRDYHGSVYWYKRDEELNANNFFNNAAGLVKPRYRYQTEGVSMGGPLYIPKYAPALRNKLFFFYNYERDPNTAATAIGQFTMPTALERAGNFSQSLNQAGALIVVKDPNNNDAPFPNNTIPSSRINPNGLALLNVFPVPNQLNRALTAGAYNYQWQSSVQDQRQEQVIKGDYKATDKDSIFFRYLGWEAWSPGYEANFGFGYNVYGFPVKAYELGYTRIITPTMVNEFTVGVRRPHEHTAVPTVANGHTPAWPTVDLSCCSRAAYGFNAGQLYPQNNYYDILPQASFSGSISDSPSFGNWQAGRFPQEELDTFVYGTDGLTIIKGTHAFKVGAYWERLRVITGTGFGANPEGNFSFNVDANNPNDTGDPYSNALLGNFDSYTESTARTRPAAVAIELDGYAQDSWKIKKNFTLEYGLRVVYYTPYNEWDHEQSTFAITQFNPANAPLLYTPTLVNGVRMALNPVTGATLNQVFVGDFVPGTGNIANGIVTQNNTIGYPPGFMHNFGPLLQPRVGLAWDVFGNGRTAVRIGVGKFNEIQRFQPSSSGPPISYNPTIYYGNLATFLTTGTALSPGTVTGYDENYKAPGIYNFTGGIQQSLGHGTVLDVKYVGNVTRHLPDSRALETLPYLYQFLPSSTDPTTGKPYINNFLAPYKGYTGITYDEAASSSNYNSLQVTAQRRLAHGFNFGVAYTWSKLLGYGSTLPIYNNATTWDYGKQSYDQTHIFNINYTYDIPGVSRHLPDNLRLTHFVLDDWQVSGITSFSSGVPQSITLTTTNSANLTGGGDGQRVEMTCNPNLPHDQRNVNQFFDTACIALPVGLGNPGDAPVDVYRGPGINNTDATLFKNFPLHNEKRVLQFRWEFYNLFNHTQFLTVNNSAVFNPTTGAQTNGLLGHAITARDARIMQVSLRLRF